MLNWKEIETVFLDMDGTLLDLYFDNFFWQRHIVDKYAEEHGVALEEAQAHLEKLFADQFGSLNWYCLDYWQDQLKLDIPRLKKEVSHLIAIRPTVLHFLESLGRSHCRSVLVTNAHRQSLEIKLDHVPIRQYFDSIFSSHDFKRAKEEDGFWDLLGEVEPFDPQKSVLFDDSTRVLEAARHYGIRRTICITQPDSRQPVREIDGFPAINLFDELPELPL